MSKAKYIGNDLPTLVGDIGEIVFKDEQSKRMFVKLIGNVGINGSFDSFEKI